MKVRPSARISTTIQLLLFVISATFALSIQGIESASSWQAQINRTVHRAHHWTWTLRRVERRDDQLIMVLAFKNNGNNKRPILLDANFMQSSVLTDIDGKQSYKLIAVEGISGEMSQVGRRKTKQSTFIFDYPQDSSKVRFSSRWLTMLMANGVASIIDVNFELQIPPPQAKPG